MILRPREKVLGAELVPVFRVSCRLGPGFTKRAVRPMAAHRDPWYGAVIAAQPTSLTGRPIGREGQPPSPAPG